MDDIDQDIALNDEIREEFKCEICHEYMHPPIRQCNIGHSFCELCFYRCTTCDVEECGAPLTETRCFTLERVHDKIRFPCINASKGCEEVVLGDAIVQHEQRCRFSWMSCVMKKSSGCKGCTWEGPKVDLIEHCHSTHGPNVITEEDKSVSLMKLFQNQEIPDGTEAYQFVEQKSQLFILAWRVVRRTDLHLVCHTVFFVGPQKDARCYFYKLHISESREPIEIRCPCRPLEDDCSLEQNWGNSLPMHCDMVKDYFKPDGLEFSVKVHFIKQNTECNV